MSGVQALLSHGRRRSRRVHLCLAAAFLAAARILAAQGIPYSVSITPEPPRAREAFSVTLLLPGTSAGTIETSEPVKARGLSLESISVSAAAPVTGEGSTAGARVIYVFRAAEEGNFRIPRLELRISGEPFALGPISLDVLPARDAPPRAPYEWTAPTTVLRWQCFPAVLKPRTENVPSLRISTLPASGGLALEAFRDLAFVGVALEEGYLSLPTTLTTEGGAAAAARSLRALPAPREISASRAIGSFSARLVGPLRRRMFEGETLSLSVEVRGSGNLPVLKAPEFTVTKAGASAEQAAHAFPVSKIRIVSGSYEGMTGTELQLAPEEPGIYTIDTEPFVFLNTETGRVETIRFAPVRISVEAPPNLPGKEAELPASLLATLKAFSARSGPLGAAASLALEGDVEAALTSLEAADGPEAFHLRGILLLKSGKKYQALATLGAAERARRYLPGLAEALARCEESVGGSFRLRDSLPEPGLFLALSVLFLTAGGALVGSSFRRPRRSEDPRPRRIGLRLAGWVLLSAAILALLLGAASALERRASYAVVTMEEAFSVPSESGSPAAGSFLGRFGEVAASSAGWTLIKFPDGSSAWFRDGTYSTY